MPRFNQNNKNQESSKTSPSEPPDNPSYEKGLLPIQPVHHHKKSKELQIPSYSTQEPQNIVEENEKKIQGETFPTPQLSVDRPIFNKTPYQNEEYKRKLTQGQIVKKYKQEWVIILKQAMNRSQKLAKKNNLRLVGPQEHVVDSDQSDEDDFELSEQLFKAEVKQQLRNSQNWRS